MKKINCIAIDDEPMALSIVAQFCERKGGLSLSTYNEPLLGLEAIRKEKPDLVFLDIRMDEIDGLEIVRQLPEESCFIFTTAYSQYALDGFDLNAVDFLRKPFSYERFEKAVEKAQKAIITRHENRGKALVVKQEYNSISIPYPEILFMEAMENYSKIFTEKQGCVLTRVNLKNLCEMLPEKDFLRVHRSYVIPVQRIRSFKKREIELLDGKTIPIGRQYVQIVSAFLNTGTASP